MKYLFIIILILVLFINGCGVIWTDNLFVFTFLKEFDASEVELISEPDYLQMGSTILKTNNSEATVITPGIGLNIGGNNE